MEEKSDEKMAVTMPTKRYKIIRSSRMKGDEW
jgi:hypothetical protein